MKMSTFIIVLSDTNLPVGFLVCRGFAHLIWHSPDDWQGHALVCHGHVCDRCAVTVARGDGLTLGQRQASARAARITVKLRQGLLRATAGGPLSQVDLILCHLSPQSIVLESH